MFNFKLPLRIAVVCQVLLVLTGIRADTCVVDGVEWTYTVDDGQATLGGKWTWGERAVPETVTGALTIPAVLGGVPVTGIGDAAFEGRPNLTAVTIPAGVTKIGFDAFTDCPNLESVLIPEGVRSIAWGTFFECPKLRSIAIPHSVTNIDECAFARCFALTSVEIPPNVTSIGEYAFWQCTGLRSVSVPASVREIADRAFSGCWGLASIDVAADNPAYCSVDGVLYDKARTRVIQCPADKRSVALPGTVQEIAPMAFGWCWRLSAVELPSGLTEIGDSAFKGCRGLTSVELPSGVRRIGESAFAECTGLRTVELPAGLESVEYDSFSDCRDLTAVTIPASLTNGVESALAGSPRLTSIEVAAGNPRYSSRDGVLYDKSQTCLEFCPAGKTMLEIPASTTQISDWCLSDCRDLASIVVDPGNPNFSSVDGVLYDREQTRLLFCPPGTKTLTIPASATTVDYWMLRMCSDLASIIVDPGNPNYSSVDGVLYDKEQTCLLCCPAGKTSVTIPVSVIDVGWGNSFAECANLESITVEEGNRYFSSWDGALYEFGRLICCPRAKRTLLLADYVSDVEVKAFRGCTALESIVLEDEDDPYFWTYDGVLYDASRTELIRCPGGKTSCVVPASVERFEVNAFADCVNLTSLTFEGDAPVYEHDHGEQGYSTFRAWMDMPKCTVYAYQGTKGWSPSGIWYGLDVTMLDPATGRPVDDPGDDPGDNPGNDPGSDPAADCTVTFAANGGTGVMPAQTFRAGETWRLAANAFVRTGYSFAGWARTAGGPAEFTDGQTMRGSDLQEHGNLTLHACWSPVVYAISYSDTRGAANSNPASYTVEDVVVFAPLADSGEWRFAGWSEAGIARGSTGDRTVSARWIKKSTVEVVPSDAVSSPVVVGKAASVRGVVLDQGGAVVGGMELKISREGAKGSKVSGSVQLFGGRKLTVKADAKAALRLSEGPADVALAVNRSGTMNVRLGGLDDGTLAFSGTWGDYVVTSGRIGGEVVRTGVFRLVGGLPAAIAGGTVNPDFLPGGEPVRMAGRKWTLAKPATVKYARNRVTKELGWIVNNGRNDSNRTNLSGLKLAYTAKTGAFKGAFSIYTLNGTKMKKVAATVVGLVVDGVGYGTVTVKGVGAFPVAIE